MAGEFTQEIEWLECDNGDTRYEVGQPPIVKCNTQFESSDVKEIGQHAPMGPGDVWFYQVIFEDDSCVRVYNMTKLFFGKPKPQQQIIVPDKKVIIP